MSEGSVILRPRGVRLQAEGGYLMVALLVAMSIMAIMMSAALPAWHTLARREKEAELVFRGEQYARAIGLYQRKVANAQVPSIDFLVEQRYLRKRYKDPITNDDFQPLGAGSGLPGQTQQGSPSQAQTGARGAASGSAAQSTRVTSVTAIAGSTGASAVVGGIVGVTSKSTDKSLRLYNGRDTYNQWVFMPVARGNAGDAGAGAAGGGRGGRGADGRGGRGGDGRGGRGATDGRGTFDLNRGFEGFNRGQGDGGRGGRGGQGGQGDTGRGGRGGTPPTR